jgi:hypothetical protein
MRDNPQNADEANFERAGRAIRELRVQLANRAWRSSRLAFHSLKEHW